MATNGDELFNPATGLRTVFRHTEETNGELLQGDWIAAGPWTTGPDHIHPLQDERFEVVSGTLGLRVSGVEHVLEPNTRTASNPHHNPQGVTDDRQRTQRQADPRPGRHRQDRQPRRGAPRGARHPRAHRVAFR